MKRWSLVKGLTLIDSVEGMGLFKCIWSHYFYSFNVYKLMLIVCIQILYHYHSFGTSLKLVSKIRFKAGPFIVNMPYFNYYFMFCLISSWFFNLFFREFGHVSPGHLSIYRFMLFNSSFVGLVRNPDFKWRWRVHRKMVCLELWCHKCIYFGNKNSFVTFNYMSRTVWFQHIVLCLQPWALTSVPCSVLHWMKVTSPA